MCFRETQNVMGNEVYILMTRGEPANLISILFGLI